MLQGPGGQLFFWFFSAFVANVLRSKTGGRSNMIYSINRRTALRSFLKSNKLQFIKVLVCRSGHKPKAIILIINNKAKSSHDEVRNTCMHAARSAP